MFFSITFILSEIASSAANVKTDWIQFSEIAFLLCQGLFISLSFCSRSFCCVFCFVLIEVHIIIPFLSLLKTNGSDGIGWQLWMAAHWFLPSRIPVITSKAVILLLPMQEWIPFSILKFLPHLVPRSIGYYRTLHELRATSITSHIKFT